MIKRRVVFSMWLVLGAGLSPALAADPTNGAAGLLITTLYQAGRIEEAYALGERYHREGPRNPRALFRYDWLLAFIGEVDRAEPLFRDLIALDKGGIYEAWGNGELAYLARARGDARGAVAFMERAVAARPADMISRVGRAQMMVEAGDARAAARRAHAESAALRRTRPARWDVRVVGGRAGVRGVARAVARRHRRGAQAAGVGAVEAGALRRAATR
jgi:Flp pilus assembly protein TadD